MPIVAVVGDCILSSFAGLTDLRWARFCSVLFCSVLFICSLCCLATVSYGWYCAPWSSVWWETKLHDPTQYYSTMATLAKLFSGLCWSLSRVDGSETGSIVAVFQIGFLNCQFGGKTKNKDEFGRRSTNSKFKIQNSIQFSFARETIVSFVLTIQK